LRQRGDNDAFLGKIGTLVRSIRASRIAPLRAAWRQRRWRRNHRSVAPRAQTSLRQRSRCRARASFAAVRGGLGIAGKWPASAEIMKAAK
jgi:hypothetical protein